MTEECMWMARDASRCKRVWIQVAGADADFRLADSPAEPDKIIENLTAGATVHLKMRAVNETGPGAFGEPVQTTVA
ncbi:MAG: hypothetical protein AAB466_03810 [Verrucomicrobiota bacterium]